LGFLLKAVGIANLLPVVQVIAVVIDGGDVKRAALGHCLIRGLVHVRGTFEGIGSRADCVPRAVGAVGMNGNLLSKLVGRVHGGFNFFIVVSLKAGGVVVRARGGVHFDDVGSRGDLLANGAQHFWNAIGDPPSGRIQSRFVGRVGNVQAVAANKHARADHFSVVDQVAHGNVHVLI